MGDKQWTRFERRGPAGWIRLTSPETRNALSGPLVKELIGHLRAAHDDDDVRVVVLTGEGPAFCAGADLKNRGDMGDAESRSGNPFVDLLKLMRDGPKPVICAVNGAAFGGGLGLVAAGDIAIAAEGAKMSFSEVRLGVIPAMISVVVLPKLGEHQAMRLFLTGERFAADRALEYGLVHAVVPAGELEKAVDAEVELICRGGPIAIREAKKLVRSVARLSEDEGFKYAEERIGKLFASAEAAEGMAAFGQKRPPSWAPDA
ncbi:MAG: enoyl-CoA hydratase/isomerase family protein [Deltaproteobacteria bacterium]|jgi:methylglutaconyl-CoA hydratase|nr:enoyl-CoA hydratase/isomerase family protein [Deltaproteobacteria bacterium]MBW2695665.1 enoyl-CoA hydratase/isomerase family protein [Deltaproteobacteria bacterium]